MDLELSDSFPEIPVKTFPLLFPPQTTPSGMKEFRCLPTFSRPTEQSTPLDLTVLLLPSSCWTLNIHQYTVQTFYYTLKISHGPSFTTRRRRRINLYFHSQTKIQKQHLCNWFQGKVSCLGTITTLNSPRIYLRPAGIDAFDFIICILRAWTPRNILEYCVDQCLVNSLRWTRLFFSHEYCYPQYFALIWFILYFFLESSIPEDRTLLKYIPRIRSNIPFGGSVTMMGSNPRQRHWAGGVEGVGRRPRDQSNDWNHWNPRCSSLADGWCWEMPFEASMPHNHFGNSAPIVWHCGGVLYGPLSFSVERVFF